MQFDLYANPDPATREIFPYLLDIQNDTLAALAIRMVVPVATKEAIQKPLKILNPELTMGKETLVVLFDEMAAYPASGLKRPLANLSHARERLLQAYDFLMQGY